MQLLNKRINLDLNFEKVIGLAIGYSSWGKTNIRTRQYQLLILCFVIELQTRTTVENKKVENSYTPHKKRKSFIAKYVLGFTILSGLCSALALQQAYELHEMSLVYLSVIFTILFILLGISYLAMDPKEKYYVG